MEPEERIIQLIDGDLSPAELAEIEQLMADHPEWKEQHALYEQIVLAIQKNGEQALRAELDGYLKEHLGKQANGKSSPFKRYFFFGGIAAVLALAVLFYQPTDPINDNLPDDWQINDKPVQVDSVVQPVDSLQNQPDSLKRQVE